MITAFAHEIEDKTNSTIEFVLSDVLEHANGNLKEIFNSIPHNLLKSLELIENQFQSVSSLSIDELEVFYLNIKRLNSFFEKMHETAQAKEYFSDLKIKNEFKSISKKLNTIKLTCYKLLMKNAPIEKTPEYIKESLAQLSQKHIAGKLPI